MTNTEQDPRPPPAWTLGWRLRRSLEYAGMDVQEMAEAIEVHRSTLSRWMHDEIEPKRVFLKEWAELTQVPLDWLVEDPPKVTAQRPTSAIAAGGGPVTDNNSYGERRRRRRRKTVTPLPAGGDDQKIFWPGTCGRSLPSCSADNHSYQHFHCDRVVYHPQDVEVKQRLRNVDVSVTGDILSHVQASGHHTVSRRRGLNGRNR